MERPELSPAFIGFRTPFRDGWLARVANPSSVSREWCLQTHLRPNPYQALGLVVRSLPSRSGLTPCGADRRGSRRLLTVSEPWLSLHDRPRPLPARWAKVRIGPPASFAHSSTAMRRPAGFPLAAPG